MKKWRRSTEGAKVRPGVAGPNWQFESFGINTLSGLMARLCYKSGVICFRNENPCECIDCISKRAWDLWYHIFGALELWRPGKPYFLNNSRPALHTSSAQSPIKATVFYTCAILRSLHLRKEFTTIPECQKIDSLDRRLHCHISEQRRSQFLLWF